MSFIGVITEKKNVSYMKKVLYQNLAQQKHTIIFITENNIENIKNIKFETLVITRKFNHPMGLKKLLKGTTFLIINYDLENEIEILQDMKLTVITYGFNLKSSITISSLEEDNILICIQRAMKDIKEQTIEPQELDLVINTIPLEKNVYDIMGIIIVLLIYGKRSILF